MNGLCIICILLYLPILCEPQVDLGVSVLPEVFLGNRRDYGSIMVKRHALETRLERSANKLRIKPFYFLSKHLLPEEKKALQEVLERAISKAESILSVIEKIDGNLLLKRRDACPVVRKSGINKGRCSRIKKGYIGEVCLDNFKIPSDHLEGFAIYNMTNPEPAKVYKKDGPGVKDADFILYVTSKTTSLCNPHKSSAIAYAATCQLGRHGRPSAGQVNFCPRNLKSQKFDEEMMYKTAIHELFHTLGFSGKLFDKFVHCDEDGKCQNREKPVVETSSGALRLVTPAVVREMQNHFWCHGAADFGGPLHSVEGKQSSHWDPVLMHSSIMTAKEQKPYTTLIDRITLAVFEDSGWYRVNYSQADPFVWGRGKGCEFITGKNCSEQGGFCTGNTNGCHHLRLSKAKCNGNPGMESGRCGVFAADQKPCFLYTSDKSSKEDETYSSQSRCFLSSLAPANSSQGSEVSKADAMTGRCYESKCEGIDVFVRVQNGEWIQCPPGSTVKVALFDGFIKCPPVEEICTSFLLKDLQSPQTAALSDAPEDANRRHLYADIRITRGLSDSESEAMESALFKILKDNKILFNELGTRTSPKEKRFCLHVELEANNTLKRSMLRKYFIKAVSDTFSGKYDRYAAVSVLTSGKYFCKKNYFGKKRPYWAYGGNTAREESTRALRLHATVMGLISLLMSVAISRPNLFS